MQLPEVPSSQEMGTGTFNKITEKRANYLTPNYVFATHGTADVLAHSSNMHQWYDGSYNPVPVNDAKLGKVVLISCATSRIFLSKFAGNHTIAGDKCNRCAVIIILKCLPNVQFACA